MPVSDSLNLLDREQLLKFSQYLLCEHQNERTVETAQQLLDKLLSKGQKEQEEDINVIAGAPDPTAGPGKAFYGNKYAPMESEYKKTLNTHQHNRLTKYKTLLKVLINYQIILSFCLI